ncbi:hypothetical protein FRC08_012168 [Ceratobasidium sp. 394]|nr:hypothetical protein FRC08_012168 [Ceratobasidium sp. 394]
MSRNKASGSSGVQKASQDKGKAAASLKRKADPTPATSSGFTCTKLENALLTLSPEAKRLLQIVNKSEETALRVAISKAILTATPSDLVVYNKLLGSLVTASTPTSTSQTPLHCVRCHTSYLQHENNSRACKIPHEEPECLGEDASDDYPVSDPGYDPRSGRELMKYPCCGQRMLEDELDYGEEIRRKRKSTTGRITTVGI